MALTLIMGRRGSGKTGAVYDEIFERTGKQSAPLYLVLPEQATFLHERRMETVRKGRHLWNFQITSFRRLAQKYMMETPLDSVGQHLFLYKVLRTHREDFQSFRMNEVSVGFIENAKRILDEAVANLLTADSMRQKAAALKERPDVGDLPNKLLDIAILMDEAAQVEPGLSVPENQLLLHFEQRIREEQLFAGSSFYFDDFSDFTAIEYRLIEALLTSGAEVTITLLWDQKEILLAKAETARQRLLAIASEQAIPVEEKRLPRPDGDGALTHFETWYGTGFLRRFEGDSSNITLWRGETIRNSVHCMAQCICSLRDEGYDLSDIGLVFRDIRGYIDDIREIFPQYRIGFYLDDPLPLHHTAIFVYVHDFLRLFAERWSFGAVFSLLKSGLSPLSSDDCDRLENYCLAHAIKGGRFYQESDWEYVDEGEDLDFINTIRRRVRDFLRPYQQRLGEAKAVVDYAAVIWGFLEESEVAPILERWREEELAAGRLLKGIELEMGLERLAALLDQMVAAFPDEAFSFDDFYDLFQMGIRTQRMRTIPPALHELEISVLGQSRPGRKRAVILGGVNEGVFPAVYGREEFLNQNDRDIIAAEDDFWPQGRDFFYENEDMLTYQALTLATERLYLMTHGRDSEGTKANASVIIYRIQQLFPDLHEVVVGADAEVENIFWAPELVLAALPLSLREKGTDSPWQQVPAYFEGTRFEAGCRAALRSLTYTGHSKHLSSSQRQRELHLSVSTIEQYLKCPFSYFAKKTLRLAERKELVFKPMDLGNIFHDALRLLLQHMKEKDIPWSDLEQEGPGLIESIMAELLPRFSQGNLFTEEQQAYWLRRMTENLHFVIGIMVERMHSGDLFVPVLWEASFRDGDELPPLKLSLRQGNVLVEGQIDRVDRATSQGSSYFRVIDYKSGNQSVNLSEMYFGIKLQLLVYMLVVENYLREQGEDHAEAAGFFYLSLRDYFTADKIGMDENKRKEERKKSDALSGYIIGDEDVTALYGDNGEKVQISAAVREGLEQRLLRTIEGAAAEILDGVNDIQPYLYAQERSCKYCDYAVVCGYDPDLHGDGRRIPKLDDKKMQAILYGEVRNDGH